MRIMYVEDDKYYQFLIRKWLEGNKHNVDIAVDMDMFREKINGVSPELIIMDIILPERTNGMMVADGGIVLAEEFRMKNERVPIVFVSAWNAGKYDSRIKAIIGDDPCAYFKKPVDFDALLAKIKSVESKTTQND